MADAALQVVVSPFLGMIFDNLSSLIGREFRLLWSVNKDLEKLSTTLSTIRLVLEDAEEKQIKDKATRDWLRKLKEAAYDADDILDECEFEALQLESDICVKRCADQVSDCLSTCFDFKELMFRCKMGKGIKELVQKFDEIAAERSKFHLSPGVARSGIQELGMDRETSSNLTEPQIYGRDGDKENIIEVLLSNVSSQNCLSICPILGIGGLGKTTLAQLVYNDERVVNQLGSSAKPTQKIITREEVLLVLDDVWDDDKEKWNKVKYLLTCGDKGSSVLVTTRLQTVVDSLSLQTVTDSSITYFVYPTYNLQYLPEHDCLCLFKQYAFGVGIVENPSLLDIGKEIVSKCGGVPLAVKALGGLLRFKREEFWRLVLDSGIWDLQKHGENTILPSLQLSYKHLSPMLRQCFAYCSIYPKNHDIIKETLIHQWMANGFIQYIRSMEVEDIGEDIFDELLRLSFFQEYQENEKHEKTFKMHDLVHDLARSVTVNECSNMKIGEGKDVPQRLRHVSVTCESPDTLSTGVTLPKSQPFFRTLYFIPGDTSLTLDHLLSTFSQLKSLRVLDLGAVWNFKSLPPWIGHLKHMRYLNLRNTGLTSLPKSIYSLKNLQILVLSYNERFMEMPSSIGNLKKLRYLDVSGTGIRLLPESTCSLTNLQTLKLETCFNLIMLPKNIRNMRNLRNLEIDWDGEMFTGMPNGIGQLTRLETLRLFMVGHASDSTACAAGIEELEGLNQLRGKLRIGGLRRVLVPKDSQKANLKSKKNLSDLHLFWSGGGDEGDNVDSSFSRDNSKEVLEGLQPHPNLQKLWIQGYPGVSFPSWAEDFAVALPKLISLVLNDMPNVEGCVVPPPCLIKLIITGCPKLVLPTTSMLPSSIEELGVERCNDPTLSSVETLPRLTYLEINGFDEQETLPEAPLRNLICLHTLIISNCEKLKRLPTAELENLTTLTKLKIQDCGQLDSITEGLKALTSLTELEIIGCLSLKSLSSESPSFLRNLTALQTLRLYDCPDLKILTVDFQHLVSLRELRFARLPQLTTLPEEIQRVTTLEGLYIWECINLTKLPEWLQHLPPALRVLVITDCHPELHRRCEKDKGEDWHKISHLRVYNKV